MFLFFLSVRDHDYATRSNKKIPTSVWIEASFPQEDLHLKRRFKNKTQIPHKWSYTWWNSRKCDWGDFLKQGRYLGGKRNFSRVLCRWYQIVGYCAWDYWGLLSGREQEVLRDALERLPVVSSNPQSPSRWLPVTHQSISYCLTAFPVHREAQLPGTCDLYLRVSPWNVTQKYPCCRISPLPSPGEAYLISQK